MAPISLEDPLSKLLLMKPLLNLASDISAPDVSFGRLVLNGAECHKASFIDRNGES
jgi:hypothetical protein